MGDTTLALVWPLHSKGRRYAEMLSKRFFAETAYENQCKGPLCTGCINQMVLDGEI